MNRFNDEIRVIPWPVWVLAFCLAGGIFAFLAKTAFPAGEMQDWPALGRFAFLGALPVVLFTWVLLIGYIYGDAKRRKMRYVMWTLLAIFIPNAIGVVLYFILREPSKQACPKCGTPVPAGSLYCPGCGTPMTRVCPQCGRSVEPGWSHCTQCGNRLAAA
jgi:hypothetical protein